jgi:hypothetical protein
MISLYLSKGINSVVAPSASQIARPNNVANPLDSFLVNPSFYGLNSFFLAIYSKILTNLTRS